MSVLTAADIRTNIEDVQARMAQAAARAGRSPDTVTLVAVTKTFPPACIEAAYEAGLRHFGENRVEEFEGKIAGTAIAHLPGMTWHMIGSIQSRKTASVAEHFGVAHSVDRFKIARRISDRAAELDRRLDLLIEVNTSGEQSKHGYDADALDLIEADLHQMLNLPAVRVCGLMTMAPYMAEEAVIRQAFRDLRMVRDTLEARIPGIGLPELSMGMSGDFEIAIEEGATIIRVGSALFGARTYT